MNLLKKQKFIKREEHTYAVFKITPHNSNLNSTSRKFQSSIFELFSYKYPKYPWQRGGVFSTFKRGNLYISLKENPKFWWIVKMYGESTAVQTDDETIEQDNETKATNETQTGVDETSTPVVSKKEGKKEDSQKEAEPEHFQRIEFYVAVPSDFKEAFKTKFSTHVQWTKATLEEVEEEFIFPQPENTDLYNMKYTRNDMFSLDFDYKAQETPIRDIMSVSREIKSKEEVSIFIQTEAVARKKWKKLVDYSWEVWDRGRVPSRAGIDPSMVLNDVTSLIGMAFFEIKGVFDETLHGISKVFFNDKSKAPEKKVKKFTNSEREALLVNGDLSPTTKKKRVRPVFKTNILFTVTSEDDVRRNMLSRSIANSFADLNGDNTLKPVKINIKARKELENLSKWKIEMFNPNMMSVDEVGKLTQLPTSELQKEYQTSLVSNRRVETELDKELTATDGILVGTSKNKEVTYPIHIQNKNLDLRSTARAIMGSPRMGKDQHVINLVVEGKKKHKMGAIVIDVINENNGHRGMADAIRDHLDPEDVIDLNLLDHEFPIYLGLEPVVKNMKDPRLSADRVAEELAYFLLTDGDEDKLQTSEFLRDAAKFANADILGIKHMFTSDRFRAKMLKEKGNIFDTDIWEEYDNLSDGKKQAIYTPVMRRIGQIYTSEFLKPILCQTPNTKLDLYNLVLEGKVIIFRMKAGVMSQRAIEILTHWIILMSYLIRLIQGGGDEEKSSGTFLVMNEPDMYLTKESADLVSRIFTQGPKYRIVPLLIFHHFQKLAYLPGFIKTMKSSSLNWHIFRNTNDDVYKELFSYLENTFESPDEAFRATKRFQYIGVWLDSEGAYYDPFIADSLPMVKDRYLSKDNSNLTVEHSRKYGTPINDVLNDIKKRNKEAKKPLEKPKEEEKKVSKKATY